MNISEEELGFMLTCAEQLLGSWNQNGAARWWNRPRKLLDGLTPLEAIKDKRWQEVINILPPYIMDAT